MKHTLYLGASLLALPLGPILDRAGARARWLRPALDGFVLVMVGALVLLHVLPHALHEAGPWAFVAAAVGLLLPAGIESLPLAGKGGPRKWTLLLAVLGLSLHALLDGAALSTAHGEADTLALAVLVHRFPVSLFLWWAVGSLVNRRAALLSLGLLGIATVAGFGFGTALMHLADVQFLGLLEAMVAGSLLHVLAGHGIEGPAKSDSGSAGPQAIGALLACALLTLPLGEVGEHGLLHGESGQRLLHLLLQSAPALLLGYLLAGFVATQLPRASVQWASRGGALSQAARGMLFGLPIPVCSCGVVPVYRGLVKAGLPATAGMAFLVATPELGIESVLLSIPLLGGPLTAVRLVAAALVALTVGVLVGRMVPRCEAGPEPSPPKLGATQRLQKMLRFGLQDVLEDTALWILLGLFVAAVLDPGLINGLTGALPPGGDVLLAALAGLPMYVCASGATPLAAALIFAGLSPGAALAFLLAGPATNVTTFGVLSRLHGRRVAITLAVVITGCAVLVGLAANAALPAAWSSPTPQSLGENLGLLNWSCLAVLTVAFVRIVALRGPRSLVQALFFRPGADEAKDGCEETCCGHDDAQAALPAIQPAEPTR